jgi:hypothetical protein
LRGKGPRRRLRVRRKRKDRDLAGEIVESGGEVVAEAGCCLIEAMGGLAVVVALLTLPAYLAFR